MGQGLNMAFRVKRWDTDYAAVGKYILDANPCSQDYRTQISDFS